MRCRLGLADRLRCTVGDLGGMTVAEFNMTVAGYAERGSTDEEDFE